MESVNNSQLDNDNWSDNSFNCSEELSKIRDKLGSLEAENGQFRTEIKTLKSDNKLLLSKLETMEQKLKVAELETKLAKQEVHNLVAEKVSEAIGQMEEKQRKNKQEDEQKYSSQMASHEKNMKAELEKMAKKLEDNLNEVRHSLNQGNADLGGKAADDHKKLEDLRKTVDALKKLTEIAWNNNKWLIDQEIMRANELTIAKTIHDDKSTHVRAQHPVSRALLALIPGQKLVYWEVHMKKEFVSFIGWIGHNVPLNTKDWIGEHPDSFSISHIGNYRESGHKVEGYGSGFGVDDVVGTGLFLTRENQTKLFFTLNGALNGEPIVMTDENSPDLLLYPAVSLYWKDTSLEGNFGANPAGKPFKFDVNAHKMELFGQ